MDLDQIGAGVVIVAVICVGTFAAWHILFNQPPMVDWSFNIPDYPGANQVEYGAGDFLISKTVALPYNVTGSARLGSSVTIRVWYYNASQTVIGHLQPEPVLLKLETFKFTVTR